MNKKIYMKNMELLLLASIMGGRYIFGVDDPYVGHTTEEILKEFEIAKEDLIKKGMILRKGNNDYAVDIVLGLIINIMLKPIVSIFYVYVNNGSIENFKNYIVGEYLNLATEPVDHDIVSIEIIRSKKQIIDDIVGCIGDISAECENIIKLNQSYFIGDIWSYILHASFAVNKDMGYANNIYSNEKIDVLNNVLGENPEAIFLSSIRKQGIYWNTRNIAIIWTKRQIVFAQPNFDDYDISKPIKIIPITKEQVKEIILSFVGISS